MAVAFRLTEVVAVAVAVAFPVVLEGREPVPVALIVLLRKIEMVGLAVVLLVGKIEMVAVAPVGMGRMVKVAPMVFPGTGRIVTEAPAVSVGEVGMLTVDAPVPPAVLSGANVMVVNDPIGPIETGEMVSVMTTLMLGGCGTPVVACRVTCQGCQQESTGACISTHSRSDSLNAGHDGPCH